jgi:hypothetical protein
VALEDEHRNGYGVSKERAKQMAEQKHPHALEDVGRGLQLGRNEPIDESIYSPGDWLLKLCHFDHLYWFFDGGRIREND